MQSMSRQQARRLCNDFIRRKYSDNEMAEMLLALARKPETSEEVSGFVDAMLENSEPFPSREASIDVCGTGGSKLERFNVSTAVAFILASIGLRVAKHGNRGSHKSNGSFDLLEALGIPINLNGDQLSEILEKTGLAFLFAGKFHPAMKNVANARRIAEQRTIFNLAGPLSNPANINKQVIGTTDAGFFELLLESSKAVGRDKCLVVSGHPGIDELSITGDSTYRTTWSNSLFTVTPEQIGIERTISSKIPCGDADKNAKEFMKLMDGNGNAHLESMVCANAGLVMACNDTTLSIQDGTRMAKEAMHARQVKHKFDAYKKLAMKAARQTKGMDF